LVVGDGAEKREETHRTIVGGEKGGFVDEFGRIGGLEGTLFFGMGDIGKKGDWDGMGMEE
jgi:hypothetical protein